MASNKRQKCSYEELNDVSRAYVRISIRVILCAPKASVFFSP
jgi:hypothetical protein